jgi:hypothetical protein
MQILSGLHNNKPYSVILGLIFFILAISLSQLSLAQAANQERAPASPSTAAVSPLPAIIKAFSGHWKVTVKFESASGLPPGTEGTGQETWRAAVGAKTLLSEESWKAGPSICPSSVSCGGMPGRISFTPWTATTRAKAFASRRMPPSPLS